jgi:DNA-binding IscR family transcriptional regulator
MAQVVTALEGTVVPMQCFSEGGEMRVLCSHELDGFEHCATRLLWTRVQGGVTRALEQTTLSELVEFAKRGAAPKIKHKTPKTSGSTVTQPGRVAASSA